MKFKGGGVDDGGSNVNGINKAADEAIAKSIKNQGTHVTCIS